MKAPACLVCLGFTLFLIASLGMTVSTQGQEIPKGVRYKKAADELNQKAQSLFENLFSPQGKALKPNHLFDGAVVCGPTLWLALKPQASENLRNAKPVVGFVQGKRPFMIDFRAFSEVPQQTEFYRLFQERIIQGEKATIRKANAEELLYYWALIPFDIEEPLLVGEFGKQRVFINFKVKQGEPKIFWIDLVGNLDELADQVQGKEKSGPFEVPAGIEDQALPKGWKRYRLTPGNGLRLGCGFPAKPVAFSQEDQVTFGQPITIKVKGLAVNTGSYSLSTCFVDDLPFSFDELSAGKQAEFLEAVWKGWAQAMVKRMNAAGQPVTLKIGDQRVIKVGELPGVEQDYGIGPLTCRIRLVAKGKALYASVAAWTREVLETEPQTFLSSLELTKP